MIRYCTFCKKELDVNTNWSEHLRKTKMYRCKECHASAMAEHTVKSNKLQMYVDGK